MSGNIVTINNFQDVQEPIIEKLFYNSVADARKKMKMDQIFTTKSTGKLTETMLSIGDIAQPETFTGQVSFDSYSQAYKTEVTMNQYAKGLKIERLLIDTNQYPELISRVVPEMARKAEYHKETMKADILNNAFTTAVATGGDTYALCAAAHTVPDGSFTQSNAGSTALSITEFKTVVQLMNQFKDYRGDVLDVEPNCIIVPTNLYSTAYEIVKSMYAVNSANNNVNTFAQATDINGEFKIITSKFLTDQNNWFIGDINYLKDMLVYFELTPIETGMTTDFQSMAAMYRVYHAGNAGFRNWWAIYGESVS